MHGNVWEWLEDRWHDSTMARRTMPRPGLPKPISPGDARGLLVVYRVSSVQSFRVWNDTFTRDYFGGFRVARTL